VDACCERLRRMLGAWTLSAAVAQHETLLAESARLAIATNLAMNEREPFVERFVQIVTGKELF